MKALVVLFAIVSFAAFGCNSADEPMAPSSGGKDGQVTGSENKAISEQDVPLTFYGYIPCCDSYVEMFGTAHVVSRKNGFHWNVKGMSGSGYTQVGGTAVNGSFHENGFSQGYRIRFVDENGCGFTLVVHYKVQENANGDIVVDILKYEVDCDND
jgi:hypothetical protein